jgi:hypothetical protein
MQAAIIHLLSVSPATMLPFVSVYFLVTPQLLIRG